MDEKKSKRREAKKKKEECREEVSAENGEEIQLLEEALEVVTAYKVPTISQSSISRHTLASG